MTWDSLGSCTGYLKGTATITNSLPRGHEVCKYCQQYLKYESAYDRYSCRITGEFLFAINKERGAQCPFDWED